MLDPQKQSGAIYTKRKQFEDGMTLQEAFNVLKDINIGNSFFKIYE